MLRCINPLILKVHFSQIYYLDKEKRRSCFLVFNHFSIAGLAHRKVTLPSVKNTCFNWRNSFDGSHQEIKYGEYCLKPLMQISQLIKKVQERNKYSVLEQKHFLKIHVLFENNFPNDFANISPTK